MLKKGISLIFSMLMILPLVLLSASVTAAENESGFCAVGDVDTENNIAAALFSDGTVKAIEYVGTDPVPGEVHEYSVSENKYTLVQTAFMPNYPYNLSPTRVFVFQSTPHIYLPDWGGYNIFLDREDASFFVRYSETEWRVFTGTNILKAQSQYTDAYVRADFTNSNHIVFTAGLIGVRDSVSGEIQPATAEQTKVFDINGIGWENGDKDVSFKNPDVGYEHLLPQKGFCAVGDIDADNDTAVVLFGDGTIKEIFYTGADPISGEVHEYTEKNGIYTLTQAGFMPTYPSGLSSTKVCIYKDTPYPYLYLPNWGEYVIYLDKEDASFFIRYSKTEWRVFAGTDILKAQDKYTDAYVRADFTNMDHIVFTAGLIGGESDTGDIIPATANQTKVFDETGIGWSTGDKDVSFHNPEIMKLPFMVEKGFCAIGEVNLVNKSAVALFYDGKMEKITYAGDAPISGEIYNFDLYNGIYILAPTVFFPLYHSGESPTRTCVYADITRLNLPDWGNYTLLLDREDAPFFVRYSKTEWRVFSGTQMLKGQNQTTSAYLRADFSDLDNIVFTAGLIGRKNTETGEIIPATKELTKVFDEKGVGWDNGDKSLTYSYLASKGDVNLDDEIDIIDLISVRNSLIGKKINLYLVDINSDGMENITDILFLKDILLLNSEAAQGMSKPDYLDMPSYTEAAVDGYSTVYDGGLFYNPLSKEAIKTEKINKYDNAPKVKRTISTGGFDAEFTLPTNASPYDVVPINYKIINKSGINYPLSLVATAFEQEERGTGNMYDLSVPGYMDINLEYLGYVTGTMKENARNILTPDNTDTPADAYPNYTTTQLAKSGTVESGDIVWLKFKYTNTGNTILDLEGIGGFTIEPRLLKKNSSGIYKDIGGLYNEYVRELTYVYPGETREFWLNFTVTDPDEINKTPENEGLTAGDYKVDFKVYYRTEYDYQPYTNIWKGRTMQEASFSFKVADTAEQTVPNQVNVSFTNGGNSKNEKSWLHYFEEFMTTYEQYGTDPGQNVLEGTLWLQIAPFTEQIVIKVIHSDPKAMERVAVPVTVNTEDTEIVYNDDNINVIVGEDGLAYPAIYGQPMSDMRANINVSPYPEKTIVQDLLDMKACGINLLNTQGAPWLYDFNNWFKDNRASNIRGDSLKYMLDLSRKLGFKLDGMGTYSYGRPTISNTAYWLTGKIFPLYLASPGEADYGDDTVAKATAPVYLYQRSRWGDLYWSDAYGNSSYTVEDTRGLMRYESHIRYAMGNLAKGKFVVWLKEKYRTVPAMNAAWGTNYASFAEVDPEKGQEFWRTNWGDWYIYNNHDYGFYEWSPALIDLDEFRTVLRVANYEDCLSLIRPVDKNAMFQVRTEGSNFVVPGLDPATTNDHYRSIIYTQLREATVAEKMVTSNAIRSYADYVTLPLTPSEVSEVVKKSVDAGIIPMLMPQFDNMRDIAINDVYGTDYTGNYNLSVSKKGALVHTLTAVFPWWKATYEAGGVPGVLWQDLQCDGIVTETQQKEMKFFKEKMERALSAPSVIKQRRIKVPNPEIKAGKYSYKNRFIEEMIADAKMAREEIN